MHRIYIQERKYISIVIITNRNQFNNLSKKLSGEEQQQNYYKEKIIIKAKDKSYADILKSIKKNVNIDKSGVTVNRIRKTGKENLLLHVNGEKEKINKLKGEIKDNKEMKLEINQFYAVVNITDIDADINSSTLKDEIKKYKDNTNDDDITILSLRPSRNGNQNATVKLPRDMASKLVNQGQIKIEWINCRLRYRVKYYDALNVQNLAITKKDAREKINQMFA